MNPGSARLPVSSTSREKPTRLLDLGALRAGALVVPEDRRPQHPVGGVEQDEPVHLAGQADRPFPADGVERRLASARHQSSGSCSAQPGCGIESGYSSSARASTSPVSEIRIALTPVVPTSRPTQAHAPSAAYTSS